MEGAEEVRHLNLIKLQQEATFFSFTAAKIISREVIEFPLLEKGARIHDLIYYLYIFLPRNAI